MASLTFTRYAKPWTLNQERSMHFRVHRKATNDWREAFKEIGERVAAGNPEVSLPLRRVIVTVTPETKTNRLPDVAACVGAAKAAVDGLRDAGVLAEDDPSIVREMRFKYPRNVGHDALTITVREYGNDGATDEVADS